MSRLDRIKPTGAFVGASWAALLIGVSGFLIGLWTSSIEMNEKGYYLVLILFGMFAAVSLQKSVRDKAEGIPVTGIYFGICWFALVAAITLLTVGLWNAKFIPSEKGFYAMAFVLSLFAVVTVQKNVRDLGPKEVSDTHEVPVSDE